MTEDISIGGAAVARRLGVHQNTVKRIPRSELPYFTINARGDRRYRVVDVENFQKIKGGRMTIAESFLAKHEGRKLDAAADLALGLMAGDRDTHKAGYSIGNALIAVINVFDDLEREEVAMIADWVEKARSPVVIHTVLGGIGYEEVVRGDATIYAFDWDSIGEDMVNDDDRLKRAKEDLIELRTITPTDAYGARFLHEIIRSLDEEIRKAEADRA